MLKYQPMVEQSEQVRALRELIRAEDSFAEAQADLDVYPAVSRHFPRFPTLVSRQDNVVDLEGKLAQATLNFKNAVNNP